MALATASKRWVCQLPQVGTTYAGFSRQKVDRVASLRNTPRLVDFRSEDSGAVNHPERSSMKQSALERVVGESPRMQEVRELVALVAATEANVLLLGESGTGKEVIAQAIHGSSARAKGPFVPVNCGAIPAELLESELFGHEKGAFTGAISARKGRFELAAGGTLFLDEIGDMPLPMQVKLLRVLQERRFERVGSTESLTADIRIVAATHRDLEQRVAQGDFRLDLYYRLNVFPIAIAPLRERREDIRALLEFFLAQRSERGKPGVTLQRCALDCLYAYAWPGNVRELGNFVERMAILRPNLPVLAEHLPPRFQMGGQADASACSDDAEARRLLGAYSVPVQTPPAPGQELPEAAPTGALGATIDLKMHLESIERGLILNALEASDWVVSHAAQRLSLRRTTLVEKMRKYALDRALPA
jgi:sigma-54 specific flagellar transcriptional regulator A